LKRIASCFVFLVFLIASVCLCSNVLESKEARKKYKPFFDTSTNYDVLFFGTSHMWNHVLPMELWKEYGIGSYNWGYSNCTTAEDYYIMKDVVKHNTPKVIVLDLYGVIEYENYNNGKYRTDRIEQQHVQFDMLPLSKNKIEGTRDIFDDYDGRDDFIWDFIMYHNRWKELSEDDFNYTLSPEKGSYYLSGISSKKYTPIEADETMEIDTVCYQYFKKILGYCSENNIELLCVYLPFAAEVEQQQVANTVGPLIEQYDHCYYLNMLNEGIVDYQVDNSTQTDHLNQSGALKVTSWLGSYLQEHYQLTDYSADAIWQRDYERYYDYKVERLKEQKRLTEYLSLLHDEDFKAIFEIYEADLMESEYLLALLDNVVHKDVSVVDRDETDDKQKGACLKLTILSTRTDEKLVEEYFEFESKDNRTINQIIKKQ